MAKTRIRLLCDKEMSLINEALKKAQSEQHGKHAPSARTPGIRPPVGNRGSKRVVLLAGGIVVLAIAGYFAWQYAISPGEPPAPQVPRKPPAPAVVTAPVVIAKPAPVVVVPPPEPVKPPEPVVPPKPAVVKPVANPAVSALVDVMRVTLAKSSTGRCVIDGYIYRVGEHVNQEPRITLLKVEDDSVIFSDANGVRYTKEVSH